MRFEDVAFAYPPAPPPAAAAQGRAGPGRDVLRGLSLEVEGGTTVALVGVGRLWVMCCTTVALVGVGRLWVMCCTTVALWG